MFKKGAAASYVVLVIFTVVLVAAYWKYTHRTYINDDNISVYTVAQAVNSKSQPSDFTVRGYVTRVYACGACSPDTEGVCAPCADKNHIIISDSVTDTFSPSMEIYFENSNELDIGTRYDFSVISRSAESSLFSVGKEYYLEYYNPTLLEE